MPAGRGDPTLTVRLKGPTAYAEWRRFTSAAYPTCKDTSGRVLLHHLPPQRRAADITHDLDDQTPAQSTP